MYLQGKMFLYLFLHLFSGLCPSFLGQSSLHSCCCSICNTRGNQPKTRPVSIIIAKYKGSPATWLHKKCHSTHISKITTPISNITTFRAFVPAMLRYVSGTLALFVVYFLLFDISQLEHLLFRFKLFIPNGRAGEQDEQGQEEIHLSHCMHKFLAVTNNKVVASTPIPPPNYGVKSLRLRSRCGIAYSAWIPLHNCANRQFHGF